MKYFTLLRANIKSQRGSFIGILILVFMTTISLLAVLSIWTNANDYEAGQIERIGYGDISYWAVGIADADKLKEQVGGLEEVEKVNVQDAVFFEEYEVRGENETTVSGSFHMLEWREKGERYYVYQDNFNGVEKAAEAPLEGEIYVSPAFVSLYDAKVGDVIAVYPVDGEEAVSFTIKGYFEDAVEGSALMGIKQALISPDDFGKLAARIEDAGMQASAQKGQIFHITKEKDAGLNDGEFQRLLSEKTELAEAAQFSYPKSAIMGFMLIIQNLFSGLLLVFVAALLAVAVIIIGYSISSSIEQDYVDMGILKAVGYTQADLRIVQMLQYLAAVLGGMLFGIPISILVVRAVNRLTVTVVGLLVPSAFPAAPAILALLFVLVVIMGFVFVKTAKIGRITPLRAIRGGVEDVYFKSRLSAPLHQRFLSFWLAYRQLVSGKRQYFSACLVTALLVFFLSLIARMDAWLGPDGKGLMDSFAASRYDLGVAYIEDVREEAEVMIDSRAGIKVSYLYSMQRACVNQVEYLMNVISKPEYFNILEGRTCLYQNEIVMTQNVAEQLGVRIGDNVSLRYGECELDFMITGIYQCANDMGANFGINKEGYERLAGGEEEEVSYWRFYLLKEPLMTEETIGMLEEKYGERLSIDENTWSGVDAIVVVASSLMAFVLVMTILFILVTVALTGSKILYREQHDLGIYKSLGFASERLRMSFALRFVMVAAAGSVLGVILSACLTDYLAGAVLKMCGISHFTSSLAFLRMLFPGVFVSMLFLVFAYLAAGKIKKVEPGILIVE